MTRKIFQKGIGGEGVRVGVEFEWLVGRSKKCIRVLVCELCIWVMSFFLFSAFYYVLSSKRGQITLWFSFNRAIVIV